jgi:hypothetical protein
MVPHKELQREIADCLDVQLQRPLRRTWRAVGYHAQAHGEAVKVMKDVPDLSLKLSP